MEKHELGKDDLNDPNTILTTHCVCFSSKHHFQTRAMLVRFCVCVCVVKIMTSSVFSSFWGLNKIQPSTAVSPYKCWSASLK